MANEITQVLGFDAGSAIATINSLNRVLGSLSANLKSVAGSAKAFNATNLSKTFTKLAKSNPAQQLNSAAAAAQNLGSNLTQVSNAGGGAVDNLNKKTKNLTISWQTLSRIIVAQTVVRGINAINRAMSDAVTTARELQKRVSEIQTIAGGALGADADITAGLQVTAETFGLDILDVAEAKYQELSNQVEGSTESVEFFNTAAKFAIATNSSLSDSVNLLSSTLNAFGQDASRSAEVAGLLFKTIEQGRIRASELANTLGRVAPLASALGVGFDEVGAALARITQGGTRADTAITQLLGILNKLSKPTDSLTEAFNRLGVATAQEGISRTGGLLPFLNRLKEVAGDDQALVGFFNNVRAIQGVLALVGTDASKTADVFEALGLTAQEAADALENAFGTAAANEAREFDKQIAELQGTFRELATVAIPLINDSLNFLNNTLETVKQNSELIFAVLGTGIAVLILFGATAGGAATAGVASLGAAIGSLILATGPLGIAFAATAASIVLLTKAINAAEDAALTDLSEKYTKIIENRDRANKELKESLRELTTEFKRGTGSVKNFLNQFSKVEADAKRQVQQIDKISVAGISSALDAILKSRQAINKEIQSAINDADSQLIKSAERQTDIRAKKEDFLLDRQLANLTDLQKAFKLTEESRIKAFEAKDLISGTTDLKDFDEANRLLERRLELAQEAKAAAETTGNRAAIFRAEQEILNALNDQINLEKQRSEIIEQRRAAAETLAAKEAGEIALLQDTIKQIQDNLSILEKGQILNPAEIKAREGEIERLIEVLRGFALEGETLDLTKILGIEQLGDVFTNRLNEAAEKIPEAIRARSDDVNAAFKDLNNLIPEDLLDIAIKLELTGDGPNQVQNFFEALQKAENEITKLTGAEEKFGVAQQAIKANQRAVLDAFDPTGPNAFVEQVVTGLAKIATDTSITEQQVKDFAKTLTDITLTTDVISNIRGFDLGKGDDVILAEKLVESFKRLVQVRKEVGEIADTTEADRARLAALIEFKEQTEAAFAAQTRVLEAIQGAGTATSDLISQTTNAVTTTDGLRSVWDGIKSPIDAATQAVNAFAAAISAIPPIPSAPAVGTMFGGSRGMLFRAAGGTARGTDTVPAMLSPGEFVVNARSSRQFSSQLTAINAGVKPIFRQEGGSVTNNSVSVGDINVNGASDPDSTARAVMQRINREVRRGTSRFK